MYPYFYDKPRKIAIKPCCVAHSRPLLPIPIFPFSFAYSLIRKFLFVSKRVAFHLCCVNFIYRFMLINPVKITVFQVRCKYLRLGNSAEFFSLFLDSFVYNDVDRKPQICYNSITNKVTSITHKHSLN